jgi:phosphopantothenate-cysteine ligase
MTSNELDTSVRTFLEDHEKAIDLSKSESIIREFFEFQKKNNRRVAIITSGGTSVPLEKNTVRSITNFSKGNRGAYSAESFLESGYAVLYCHAILAKMPFSPVVTPRDLEIKDDLIVVTHQSDDLKKAISRYQSAVRDNFLCEIPFETVQEYLLLLRTLGIASRILGKNCLFFAAAAVSDFYLPFSKMETHKIQSRNIEGLELKLDGTPKMLQPLKSEWSPESFLVTFKLETDGTILNEKIRYAMEKYKIDLVIGNMLQNYQNSVIVCDGKNVLKIDREDHEAHLEPRLIAEVIRRHEMYLNK